MWPRWVPLVLHGLVLGACVWLAARPDHVLALLRTAAAHASRHDRADPYTGVFPAGVLVGDRGRFDRFAADCGRDALYTPACRQECAALSNLTVRTPKAAASLLPLVSCHHCPSYPPEPPTPRTPVPPSSHDPTDTAAAPPDTQNEGDRRAQSEGLRLASADGLFPLLARWQAGRAGGWGKTLDAGTGPTSLAWLLRQSTDDVIAVTASAQMAAMVQHPLPLVRRVEEGLPVRDGPLAGPAPMEVPAAAATPPPPVDVEKDEPRTEAARQLGWGAALVVCDWAGDDDNDATEDAAGSVGVRGCASLLRSLDGGYGAFATVVADYLVGAVDGFAPFAHEVVLARVAAHVARGDHHGGGRLYVTGMEPYPERAASPGGQLIIETGRTRDACIMLARERPYREYPREWVERTLRVIGMEVVHAVSLPTVYGPDKLLGQLDVCRNKLARGGVAEPLRSALEARVNTLAAAVRADPGLRAGLCFGQDWAIEARWPSASSAPDRA